LRISKHWNQHPKWFTTLPHDLQIELIAEYNLHHETKKEYDKRKMKYGAKKWDQKK
jgi:hypothetical protein